MTAAFPLPDVDPQGNALRFMQRVRWLGAIFTLVQFWLYRPPPGLTAPFDQVPTGVLLAGVIAAINVIVIVAARRLPSIWHRHLVLTSLVLDAMVVFGVVWLFRFDTTSALWGLLVIPVLEAAVAAQLAGALAMWAALTVAYVIREAQTAADYDYAIFEIPSLTFRMGIVLIVAATAGSLARSLTHEIRSQSAARLESQQRARLLHGLALSSQALIEAQTHTDAAAVWNAIVGAAVDVGFDGAGIMVRDPGRHRYIVACASGLPDGLLGTVYSLDSGIAGAVWERHEAVVVEDYSNWAAASPNFKEVGYGSALAVPIWRDLEIEAVLVAAYRRTGPMPRPERECIELLAVHAAVALNTVAHSAERDRYEQRLTEIAYTDALTGLPNRDIFQQRLAAAAADPASDGVSVLFIDIDRFKTVNDSLGHHGGDILLAGLAKRLVKAAHPHLVARFGGDEFTVLAEGMSCPDQARALALDLMTALSSPLFVAGQEILPSVSVGIRSSGSCGDTADVLLRDADTAMYRAKKLGRQRVEVFDPEAFQGVPSLSLEAEMRRALEAGEFQLHYQPVVALADGRIDSVEALLRWNHPTRGMIAPIDFIPLAEDSGFIVQLGRWVLQEACAQTARWLTEGRDLNVAVNVSVVQLQHCGLLEDIDSALTRSSLPASRLILEITESATVTDPDLMLSQARRIRELGVHLALDDFGQGTTSLRFVRRLPLGVLKIDKSFVDDLLLDRDSGGDQAAVVRSVIRLAHDLGLTVTAEGVEQERQMAVLEELGCDHAQGYLLGRPMPADAIGAAVDAASDLGVVRA